MGDHAVHSGRPHPTCSTGGINTHEVLKVTVAIVRVRRSVIPRGRPCVGYAGAECVHADVVEHVVAIARGKGLRSTGIGARAPRPRSDIAVVERRQWRLMPRITTCRGRSSISKRARMLEVVGVVGQHHTKGIATEECMGFGSSGFAVASGIHRRFNGRVVDGFEPAVDGVGVINSLHAVLTDLDAAQGAVHLVGVGCVARLLHV